MDTNKKKSINSDVLKRGLSQLPEYSPPPRLWQSIGSELDDQQSGVDLLRNGVRELPVHPAPDGLWLRIEAELPPAKGRVRRLFDWRLIASSAAAVAIVAAAMFWLQPTADSEQLTYHEEVVDDALFAHTMDEEPDAEAAIEAVLAQCFRQTFICESEEVVQLRTELTELSAVVNELRTAIGSFGDNPDLMLKLAKFERQRSKIVREISTIIL